MKLFSIYKSIDDPDCDDTLIAITSNQQKAQELVDMANKAYADFDEKYQKIKGILRDWNKQHPLPDPLPVMLRVIPKWATHVPPTDEMRAEQARINAENERLRFEAETPVRESEEQQNQFKDQLLSEMFSVDDWLFYNSHARYLQYTWYIKESNLTIL